MQIATMSNGQLSIQSVLEVAVTTTSHIRIQSIWLIYNPTVHDLPKHKKKVCLTEIRLDSPGFPIYLPHLPRTDMRFGYRLSSDYYYELHANLSRTFA